MPTIIVDMSSDGHKSVEVSDAEFDLLCDLEEKYGTIHDAMNKLQENHEFVNICKAIINRKPAKIRSFIFYM